MFGSRKQEVPFVSAVSIGLLDFSNSGANAANLAGLVSAKAAEYLQMLLDGIAGSLQNLPESAKSKSPRQGKVTCFVSPRTGLEIAIAREFMAKGAELRLLLPQTIAQMPQAVQELCLPPHTGKISLEVENNDLTPEEQVEIGTQLQETLIRQSDLLLVIVNSDEAEAEQAITAVVARESRSLPVIMLPVHDLKRIKLLPYGTGTVQPYENLDPELRNWLQRLLQPEGKRFKSWEPGFTMGGLYQWCFALLLRNKPSSGHFWIRHFAAREEKALQLPENVLQTMYPANRSVWMQFSRQYAKGYVWADLLGIYFGNRFRLQILFTIFFSALAALAVLWMLFQKGAPIFFLVEGISLFIVLSTVVVITVRKEKQNWIDYRLLAEFLRPMPYLACIGRRFRPFIRDIAMDSADQEGNSGERANAAGSRVLWQYESILREIEVPPIKVNKNYLTDVKQALLQLTKSQCSWHRGNEEKHLKVHHFLHRLTLLVFMCGLAISLIHAATAFPQIQEHISFLQPHATTSATLDIERWLLFLAGTLGVFGSALGAALSYFGFAEIAERSGSARWQFERVQREMEGDHGIPTFRQITGWANEVSKIMAEEQLDWYNQMSRISVHLG